MKIPRLTRKGKRVVHVADLATMRNPVRASKKCDIVCMGDSITGWNNAGESRLWPRVTYPVHLQRRLNEDGRKERVANGGIAGEVSENGPRLVDSYLKMFPNAKYFIIGFGSNDLGLGQDRVETSKRVVGNMDRMVEAVRKAGRTPIVINVPRVNSRAFPKEQYEAARRKREHHNPRLKEHFEKKGVDVVDIHSVLGDEHFADNLHPNDLGAKAIADRVYERLISYLT